MQFLNELFDNYIALSAFLGWFSAQALKFVIVLLQYRRFQWERLIGSGGFPSSHSSLVVALSTATAYIHGITSDLSVICITFSLIVMYDASGVRREAGRQAQILNQLMEHFKSVIFRSIWMTVMCSKSSWGIRLLKFSAVPF